MSETAYNKSESMVTKILSVLSEDLINQFDEDLDKDNLYNLASGCHAEDAVP